MGEEKQQSVARFAGGAGGWNLITTLDFLIEEIPQSGKTIMGHDYSRTHNMLIFDFIAPKQRASLWTGMCERDGSQISSPCKIEAPLAKGFWHMIRVHCWRVLRRFGHD